MRYFLRLSYLGARFCGWQKQPNGVSIQETLETALSTILREPVTVTGCGRTDAGVHATYYIAHFDAHQAFPSGFLRGLNSLLPADIAVQSCLPVDAAAHARYDAFLRSYIYTITRSKDPFLTQTTWFYPQAERLDLKKMEQVANVLPRYTNFYTFCKTDSGLDHFDCLVREAKWEQDGNLLRFHISANRFLRGMVRLIVGASVQAGLGKVAIPEIEAALVQRQPLQLSLSVPPEGLALSAVHYPYPVEPPGY